MERSPGPTANGGIASALGSSSSAAANLVLDGGTLATGGGTDRLFTLTANGGTLDNTAGLSMNATGAVALTSGASTTLTLTGTNINRQYFNLALGDPAGGGFTTSVLKTGSTKWTFSSNGTKTYSGDTHVVAGTLETLNSDVFSHNSSMVLDAGATLELHNNNATIDGLAGAGTVVNSFNSGTRTLTIGFNGDGATFSGRITSGQTLNLVKTGAGTQIFAGVNAYSGSTTVSGGTLTIDTNGSITSTAITTAAGATLNVNGLISATANLTANGAVNFAGNTGPAQVTRALAALSVGAAGR